MNMLEIKITKKNPSYKIAVGLHINQDTGKYIIIPAEITADTPFPIIEEIGKLIEVAQRMAIVRFTPKN